VFVCGYGGQVYRRSNIGWIHADEHLLDSSPGTLSLDLLDIDGTSPDDIYAVGTGGLIFHYDGKKWSKIDSPTNKHLTRVRCVSKNEVYACGYSGTVIRGKGNTWEDISTKDIMDNYYGIEAFGNSIYLARNSGLLRFSGREFELVDIGSKKNATFHRLHANDDVLWSFGTDDLFWFDGEKWTEVIHPDNKR
jgi:hypothetical protein